MTGWFSIFLPVVPQGKGRPRFGNGRTYTPTKTRNYEALLKVLLKNAYQFEKLGNAPIRGGTPLTGPLEVKLLFRLPRPKINKRLYPDVKIDLDNCIKAILDAANGILWKDDCQIVSLLATKRYANEKNPVGIDLMFCEYDDA